MKCSKCGYDWRNSGDSAHVCGPVKVKQQEQGEPTGMLHIDRLDKWLDASLKERKQRTWVGLTNEEILSPDLYILRTRGDGYEYAKAIEAKLKEKNT